MKEKVSVLIADDNQEFSHTLSTYINAQDDMQVVGMARDGEEAIEIMQDITPDVVLLDVIMPHLDGLGVLEKISTMQINKKPICIMLSAVGQDKITQKAIALGAEYYVVKPFDLAVLYSRILALLRRTASVTETKLFCDNLMLDKEKTAVYDGQEEVIVSQPEYRILLILMESKGKTVTRNQLLEQVWDRSGNYVNDNTLTVTMKRLREKLNHPACLKTIRSFGYRMEDTQ